MLPTKSVLGISWNHHFVQRRSRVRFTAFVRRSSGSGEAVLVSLRLPVVPGVCGSPHSQSELLKFTTFAYQKLVPNIEIVEALIIKCKEWNHWLWLSILQWSLIVFGICILESCIAPGARPGSFHCVCPPVSSARIAPVAKRALENSSSTSFPKIEVVPPFITKRKECNYWLSWSILQWSLIAFGICLLPIHAAGPQCSRSMLESWFAPEAKPCSFHCVCLPLPTRKASSWNSWSTWHMKVHPKRCFPE